MRRDPVQRHVPKVLPHPRVLFSRRCTGVTLFTKVKIEIKSWCYTRQKEFLRNDLSFNAEIIILCRHSVKFDLTPYKVIKRDSHSSGGKFAVALHFYKVRASCKVSSG